MRDFEYVEFAHSPSSIILTKEWKNEDEKNICKIMTKMNSYIKRGKKIIKADVWTKQNKNSLNLRKIVLLNF